MSNVTIDDIRRSIRTNGNDAFEVKKNLRRLRAMRRELVRILGQKIDQFESINTFDTQWRLALMRGQEAYDASHSKNMRDLYREWLTSCQQYIPDIELIQKSGLRLRKSKEFLERVSESRGILQEDDTFFSSEKLADLKDRAIDEFRSGQCEST